MSGSFGFAVTEVIRNIRDRKLTNLITVATITLSLLVFGSFALVTGNLFHVIDYLKSRIEMELYLSDSLPEEEMQNLLIAISKVPGTMKTSVISKDKAARDFVEIYGEELIKEAGENPLPRSVRLIFAPQYRLLDSLRVAETRIMNSPAGKWITDIDYGKSFVEKAEKIYVFFIIIDVFLGIIISLSSVFIIANTVGFTIMVRANTIEIMELVGATRRFIGLPYRLEGTIHGFAGGFLASILLFAGYKWYLIPITSMWVVKVFPGLAESLEISVADRWTYDITALHLFLLIPIGGILGNLGARIALRRMLR